MIKRAKKLSLIVIVFLASAIIMSSCAISKNTNSSTDTKDKKGNQKTEDSFVIVTSFYPMYISTINIARDIEGVSVVNMTKSQSGCLHDYQLKPEDLKILERADVFVINGAGMESFMDKVIAQQKNLNVIEASENISLIQDESGEENPHVWVSVTNAILQVENISKELSRLDPIHADQYKKNATTYIQKLEELKDKMHGAISQLKNKDIITFHEAFPYFAQEFNFNIVSVIEREPGSAPTAQQLEETIDIIKAAEIKALFAEPQYSTKAAEIISLETGAKLYTLDPVVTGEAVFDAYDDYIQKMEQNLLVLQEALN